MRFPLRTHILVAGLLWLTLLFAVPPVAKAGLVLGPPIYLGLSSGLVGWWTMDGADTPVNASGIITALDRSGKGNNGIAASAAVAPQNTIGKIGQALSFDGVDDYLNANSDSSIDNLTQKTVCAWVNATTSGAQANILSKNTNGSDPGWLLYISNSPTLANVAYFQGRVTHPGEWRAAPSTFTFGTWQHLCVTYDGSLVTNVPIIYINAISKSLTELQTASGALDDGPNENLLIGRISGSPATNFAGKIDDVRIYNRILSNDEIKRLYNIGGTLHFGRPNSLGSLSQGLVGWWTFDGADLAGTHAYDRSGNANDGTIQTGPVPTIGKIGQALMFHQENTGVLIADPKLQDIHNITISAWIKLNTYPTCGGDWDIVQKATGPASGWTFKFPCNLTNTLVFGRNFTGAGNVGATASNNVIGVGAWYHILVTDASTTAASDIHIYVNGAEVTYQSTTDGVGGQKSDAGFDAGISSGVDGAIDDVRVYNRVLSGNEIKRLYNIGGTLHSGVSSSNGSLASGLVGWWTMDGNDTSIDGSGVVTVNDRSGNNSTALSDNSDTAPSRTTGKVGQAMKFNGSQILPIQSDPVNLQITTSFTIAAWAKATIINPGDVFARSDSNNDGYGLDIDGGGDCTDGTYNVIETTLGSAGVGFVGWCGGTVMLLGNWYHVATVYNSVAQTVHSYVNGVDDSGSICVGCGDTTIPTAFNPTGLGPPTIGGDGGNRNTKFNGSIDDVRVYNRALSASEIKRLYNMGH